MGILPWPARGRLSNAFATEANARISGVPCRRKNGGIIHTGNNLYDNCGSLCLMESNAHLHGRRGFHAIWIKPLYPNGTARRRTSNNFTAILSRTLTDSLQSIKPLKAMARENLADAALETETKRLNKACKNRYSARRR